MNYTFPSWFADMETVLISSKCLLVSLYSFI
nr:MAG TPA: hypothetical protein [Caudoviricetes sp.]